MRSTRSASGCSLGFVAELETLGLLSWSTPLRKQWLLLWRLVTWLRYSNEAAVARRRLHAIVDGVSRASKLFWSVAGMSVGGAVLAEVAHDKAAPAVSDERNPVAVVVLGHRSRKDGRPHPVQKFRARIAVETARRHHADVVLFCGGSFDPDRPSQADVTAGEAVRIGLDIARVRTETHSMSVSENVELAMPLVESCGTVLIVSDPLDAARARRLWLEARPEDEGRVVVTDCVDRLEAMWVKVPTLAVEMRRRLLDRRRSPSAST